MSRCAQTDAILDAVFASADLTKSQADHAAGCSECARALAHARRFDGELHRTGAELSPEPMPAPHEVLTAMNDDDRRAGSPRQRLLVGGFAAVGVLAVAAFIGGEWLGTVIRPLVEPQFGSVPDAAALIGAPQRDVLVTEDGVLGVRDLGETFELVLVRSTTRGLEQYVLDSVPTNTISVIGCPELARGDFVWGHSPDVIRVDGPGDYVIRDGMLLIFVYGRDVSPADVGVNVVGRNGTGGMEVRSAELARDPCLVPVAARDRAIVRPEVVQCSDWHALDEDEQVELTRAVIFEWLVPAVRARQQMPDAPVDEVVLAARESIDKACQEEAIAEMLVTDVAIRLYGD